ncbi:MAG: LuxR C-terminal-related transcriptional regulator [Chloroflexi bacterium]|nr:LuxR C-terminal-related transcriptional regulator [Chloroflexota bacterium]
MLRDLESLIGAESSCYFEFRRADRHVLAYATTPVDSPAPGSEGAEVTYGHQNPIGWRRWTPAAGPMRFSGMAPRRELDRLEFVQCYMRPNRIRDMLKVWLWSSPYSAACIQLERADAEFTTREMDLLGVLQQHLIEARARALAGDSPMLEVEPSLTRREVEILTWAARGNSDDQIAARLLISTGTVGKHLEHAYDKLGVHSRAEALALLSRLDRSQ